MSDSTLTKLELPLALGLLALGGSFVGVYFLKGKRVPTPPAESSRGPSASSSAAAPGSRTSATPRAAASVPVLPDELPPQFDKQKELLINLIGDYHQLPKGARADLRKLFLASKLMGQGNPEITKHPMTRSGCRALRAKAKGLPKASPQCGAANMVYVRGAKGQNAAKGVCIDQFEYPNIPCEYPVTYVRASEAAALCHVMGKRLCDAHEWEGACAGEIRSAQSEYLWPRPRREARFWHNKEREKVWAYGKKKDHGLCGTKSFKHRKCHGSFHHCGSNTYPAGAHLACVSAQGVYDQHGNAAEHMSLPLSAAELASTRRYGETEMKGSWFIFSQLEAHLDDCRWRAPNWHPNRVLSDNSHRNYHLSFRCCKDL